MPKLLNFRFSEGGCFFNCDNTELKRSSNVFIFFNCYYYFLFPNGVAGRTAQRRRSETGIGSGLNIFQRNRQNKTDLESCG